MYDHTVISIGDAKVTSTNVVGFRHRGQYQTSSMEEKKQQRNNKGVQMKSQVATYFFFDGNYGEPEG